MFPSRFDGGTPKALAISWPSPFGRGGRRASAFCSARIRLESSEIDRRPRFRPMRPLGRDVRSAQIKEIGQTVAHVTIEATYRRIGPGAVVLARPEMVKDQEMDPIGEVPLKLEAFLESLCGTSRRPLRRDRGSGFGPVRRWNGFWACRCRGAARPNAPRVGERSAGRPAFVCFHTSL